MATIHLNNKDLHTMIREAAERLCEEQRYEKYAAQQNLPDGDLKAIQDYFRDMNQKNIELEPIYEFTHKVVKKALREALSSQANTNTSGTRKSRKNDFCA